MRTSAVQLNYSIPMTFSYRLIFTENVFDPNNLALIQLLHSEDVNTPYSRVLLFLDESLSQSQPHLKDKIQGFFYLHQKNTRLVRPPFLLPGGEEAKQRKDLFDSVVQAIHDAKICRHSYVVVVGGGAVIDLVCFAASIVHRGVRQIRIPTTVLAQDDAGIGIKNGIDAFGKKNFLGSFYPPYAVINDSQFLTTLDQTNWISGIAEAIKVALIKDSEFFYWIKENALLLKNRDLSSMKCLIQKCAELHIRHITTSGDPFEQGSARPLDFGHWVAHKLEQLSGYRLSHGHSVATGMAVDLFYSLRMGWLSRATVFEIIDCLKMIGFQLWQPLLIKKNSETQGNLILEGLEEFREHLGGTLNITLIRKIGESFQVNDMNSSEIINAIDDLKQSQKIKNNLVSPHLHSAQL